MWEILDNNGVIHSGSEDEMRHAFSVMTVDDGSMSFTDTDIQQYYVENWSGDLKLVEVHSVIR